MRVIAVMTLIYLPATFSSVSEFSSLSNLCVLEQSKKEHDQVSVSLTIPRHKDVLQH